MPSRSSQSGPTSRQQSPERIWNLRAEVLRQRAEDIQQRLEHDEDMTQQEFESLSGKLREYNAEMRRRERVSRLRGMGDEELDAEAAILKQRLGQGQGDLSLDHYYLLATRVNECNDEINERGGPNRP